MTDPLLHKGAVQERWSFDSQGKLVYLNKVQEVSGILEGARFASEHLKKDTGPARGRYLGTVPLVVALQWSNECGAAIGTKEFAKYAKRKLADPDFSGFRVHMR